MCSYFLHAKLRVLQHTVQKSKVHMCFEPQEREIEKLAAAKSYMT
jgi:hypothetical protein